MNNRIEDIAGIEERLNKVSLNINVGVITFDDLKLRQDAKRLLQYLKETLTPEELNYLDEKKGNK